MAAHHLTESVASASDANLRYVQAGSPGIRRSGSPKRFVYLDSHGKRIRDKITLTRIRSLVIPPAWRDVWICPTANGHLQAIGKDARGRKQYRYHPRYREVREESKYERMIDFAKALPKLRRRTAADLRRKGLPREKVLAAVVQVLEKTLIRVGNEEYKQQNHSYGLTTIHNRHVKVRGSRMHFEFRGKSGVEHEIDLNDPRLAKIVGRCQQLPGEELFCYINESGDVVDVNSSDVNEYLREITGEHFTAKDFRTWAGTVLAATALRDLEAFDSNAQAKKNVVAAVESVARKLGNTKAVCRKCYIHPAIVESYLDGTLMASLSHGARQRLKPSRLPGKEAAILRLLQHRLGGKTPRP